MMNTDELLFFSSSAQALPIYAELRGQILSRWPEVEIRVAKTQISFKARYGFAFVSTWRMGRRCPEVFIVVSFGLGRKVSSERILAASEPYPGRWTHHVVVASASEVDSQLLGWIAEAHDFALAK